MGADSRSCLAGTDSEIIEFVDDFGVDGVARLVAVDVNEKAEGFVVLHDWESFGAKFFKASVESFEIFVVAAVATIAESFGGDPAILDIGLGDIQEENGFDWMSGGGSRFHDFIFFSRPAANGRKDERDGSDVLAGEVR